MPNSDDCGTLSGYFEAVQAMAEGMAIKWGWGRLERLVGQSEPDLLAKFRRQQATWSAAYQAAWASEMRTRDQLAAVMATAPAMLRGGRALDAKAEELGHRPIQPWVWEVPLATGEVAAVVQTDAEVAMAQAGQAGRYVSVYTLAEIGCVIDAIPGALQMAKAAWPGAKFQPSRSVPAGPAWSDEGDAIPFGAAPPPSSGAQGGASDEGDEIPF